MMITFAIWPAGWLYYCYEECVDFCLCTWPTVFHIIVGVLCGRPCRVEPLTLEFGAWTYFSSLFDIGSWGGIPDPEPFVASQRTDIWHIATLLSCVSRARLCHVAHSSFNHGTYQVHCNCLNKSPSETHLKLHPHRPIPTFAWLPGSLFRSNAKTECRRCFEQIPISSEGKMFQV